MSDECTKCTVYHKNQHLADWMVLRNKTIVHLRRRGVSFGDIAKLPSIGLSRQQVHRIWNDWKGRIKTEADQEEV